MKKIAIIVLLYLPLVASSQTWISRKSTQKAKLEEARNAVISEQFIKAVELYASLVNKEDGDANNGGDLLAEYAYALALSHNFDFALATIDKARMNKSKYLDFYTNQVLGIMGLRKLSSKFHYKEVPKWVVAEYRNLLSSHSVEYNSGEKIPRSELDKAYKLLSQKQFVRSLVILYKLEQAYPNAYAIPLVGSNAWECLENFSQAASCLEKAIQMMGDEENVSNKDSYIQQLNHLKGDKRGVVSETLKKFAPRLMTYIGVFGTTEMLAFNGRVGLYTNDLFSSSVNVSLSRANGQFNGNVGLSAYKTWHIFVAGLGISYQFGGESNTLSLAPSAGLTFLSEGGKSSFDIMFNCYVPFSSKGGFSYGITIGKTFYL